MLCLDSVAANSFISERIRIKFSLSRNFIDLCSILFIVTLDNKKSP